MMLLLWIRIPKIAGVFDLGRAQGTSMCCGSIQRVVVVQHGIVGSKIKFNRRFSINTIYI